MEDQETTLDGISFPKTAKKAHLLIEINGEEFSLFEHEFENEETKPFVMSFQPVKIDPEFKGKYKAFGFSPTGSDKSFSITYKIIE